MSAFKRYWLLALAGTLAAAAYPLYMGARVITDMLCFGTVDGANYPKYVIPYTPIALALILSVALMPLIIKLAKRCALLAASGFSVIVFFASELLLESQVMVTTTRLENWQMYSCYVVRDYGTPQTITQVDVLMGRYSSAFKLHFYVISVILMLALLNSLYGFAKMILTGNFARKKALTIQAALAGVFLGLCIFACFTAFYRTGELNVFPISAILMGLFFTVMGVTAGVFLGSLTLNRRRLLSAVLPAALSSVITLVMYVGELILLRGNLYRFGTGFLFNGLGCLALAPVDILIILLSGLLCYFICRRLNRQGAAPSAA